MGPMQFLDVYIKFVFNEGWLYFLLVGVAFCALGSLCWRHATDVIARSGKWDDFLTALCMTLVLALIFAALPGVVVTYIFSFLFGVNQWTVYGGMILYLLVLLLWRGNRSFGGRRQTAMADGSGEDEE